MTDHCRKCEGRGELNADGLCCGCSQSQEFREEHPMPKRLTKNMLETLGGGQCIRPGCWEALEPMRYGSETPTNHVEYCAKCGTTYTYRTQIVSGSLSIEE